MFTLQRNVYTVAISSVNKIVINEWLRLNNSAMYHSTMHAGVWFFESRIK
jgi:hypothetical protein